MSTQPEALLQRLERLGQDSVGNYGMPICADAAAELRRLHAENAELLEALKRHGAHDGNCDYLILLTSLPPMRKPCSCGLHAVIARAEGEPK